MTRLPDFVIIGAAKSASTWLHLALRQHPAVYMPRDETPFFEDPFYDANDLSALSADLQAAPADALLGIKCPNYLCTPQCAVRLARHLPHVRLIAILRNPVDRAISQYYHLIRAGQLPVVAADAAFGQYLAGHFDPPYTQQLIMDFGLYGMGVENFRRLFPAEQLLVLTDLDMGATSLGVFRRACEFLGIESRSSPGGISVPRNQGVYSSPFLSFVQWMNHHGTTHDPVTGVLRLRPGPIAWAARRVALLGSRVSAATRIFVRPQEPEVSQHTRAALLDYYLPDIARLEAMTSMDLSAWKVGRGNAA
jgi:hypothetical protein